MIPTGSSAPMGSVCHGTCYVTVLNIVKMGLMRSSCVVGIMHSITAAILDTVVFGSYYQPLADL